MNFTALLAGDLWWLLPLMIFAARVIDVSLGTLRLVFVSRGLKLLAPLIGFCEVLIWITAIAQILRNLDNWVSFVAYAGGYATGTFVGMCIEERLALGSVIVQIIPQRDASALTERLDAEGFRTTRVKGRGLRGPVTIIYTLVRRKRLNQLLSLVRAFNPNAFFTIEDVRGINEQHLLQSHYLLARGQRPGK